MPACDARYDVILADGRSFWAGSGSPSTQAVVDFEEDRLPDDWGDPGPLVSARLVRYLATAGKRIQHGPVGVRNRMSLWVEGKPCHVSAKHRRYLRWHLPDACDPCLDDDPGWQLAQEPDQPGSAQDQRRAHVV